MTGSTHRPSSTVTGAALRRRLGPLPRACQGWTPCLPAARCLHAAVGGSSGTCVPWGGAAQSAATRLRGLHCVRPFGPFFIWGFALGAERADLHPFGLDFRYAKASAG